MTRRAGFPPGSDVLKDAGEAMGEQHFQAIYDSVNDGIFLQELGTGAILDVNRRMCE